MLEKELRAWPEQLAGNRMGVRPQQRAAKARFPIGHEEKLRELGFVAVVSGKVEVVSCVEASAHRECAIIDLGDKGRLFRRRDPVGYDKIALLLPELALFRRDVDRRNCGHFRSSR